MESVPAPAERLAQLRAQFAAWRLHRIRGTRIPEDLWSAATEVARTLGANRVAWALRLDPATLRSRVARSAGAESTPTFIEIAPATLRSAVRGDAVEETATIAVCAVEVGDACGRRLRVELATGTTEWLAVARGLWSLAR